MTGALGPIGFGAQNSVSERLTSFGDPAPQLSWKSNQGVNNFMIYTRGGVPIGAYNAERIVNLGDGHASLDNGLGYTYFNAATGLEFSAVTGLTYNFKNPHTDYQNGIDWHLDLESLAFCHKTVLCGCSRLLFQSADWGQWLRRNPWCLHIAHCRRRTGDWNVVSYRRNARLPEP